MTDVLNIFKALSDGTRLRILNILLERECCVCEVMQVLGISQPSASRHLSILHDAGLLKAKKQGIWVNYAVDYAGMPKYAREIMKAIEPALAEIPEAEDDRLKLRKTVRQNALCAS